MLSRVRVRFLRFGLATDHPVAGEARAYNASLAPPPPPSPALGLGLGLGSTRLTLTLTLIPNLNPNVTCGRSTFSIRMYRSLSPPG